MLKPSIYFLSVGLLCAFVAGGAYWYTAGRTKQAIKPSVLTAKNVQITLKPVGGDAAAALFKALEFSPKHARFVRKTGCLFSLSFRHNRRDEEQKAPILVELGAWQVRDSGEIYAPWTKPVWDRLLFNMALPEAHHKAFEARRFKDETAIHPGDTGRGLIGFALPPNRSFKLRAVWRVDEKIYAGRFKNLTCPPTP